MRLLLTFVILGFACCGHAQNWQSQVGINLATLPGKSIEITSEFSPNLNAWALTLQGGYTFQNSFGGFASGYMCDCGVDDIKTSGAFLKAGARIDVIRSSKPTAKVGLKLGSAFLGSSYDQKGIINSFSSGEKMHYLASEHGIRIGLALSAAAAFRLSSRWGLDVGLQKFVPFSSRDNYLISGSFMSHQPGVGLLSQEAIWYTGLQGIVTIHYQLN